VEPLAVDRGLSFEMTAAVDRDLRDAGATDALLQALGEIASKAAPSAPPKPQPAPAAPTVLVIQSKPGEAQGYVDDVFSGKTSSAGVLRIPPDSLWFYEATNLRFAERQARKSAWEGWPNLYCEAPLFTRLPDVTQFLAGARHFDSPRIILRIKYRLLPISTRLGSRVAGSQD